MASNDKLIPRLADALATLRATPPRIIASPPTQPRRAAVAILIRVVPGPGAGPAHDAAADAPPPDLAGFFAQPWVHAPGAQAEVLFLQRGAARDVSFPGGRMDDADEGAMYTAMRQTWEEIGVDLAERDFVCVGQLDDREITTSLGKRLLMILSPFVFLQVTPAPLTPDPLPDIALHWIPLSALARPLRGRVTADIAARMAPRLPLVRRAIRLLLGSMRFAAAELPAHGGLQVWGLTLGMSLDLLALMRAPPRSEDEEGEVAVGVGMAPSMASVFPRFSYPDVNFWIWVFGKRYRDVIREWEASVCAGGAHDRRVNWVGTAVNAFYGAVRRALVVVIVLRALGLLLALGIGAWWAFT